MIYRVLLSIILELTKIVALVVPKRKWRHKIREKVRAYVLPLYFRLRYLPRLVIPAGAKGPSSDNIWQIWFQGEDKAPPIVKACFRSVEKFKGRHAQKILDAKQLSKLIKLPDYIEEKYRRGKIKIQHYSDLVRLELLYQYGGIWMDATNLMTAPIPEIIDKSGFFVFHTGSEGIGSAYAMFQNCFIVAKKGDPLLAMWRQMCFEFWKRENYMIDYFYGQIMLKALVLYNPAAAREYAKMPRFSQDPTHIFCHFSRHDLYGKFDRKEFCALTANSFFQKLRYRKEPSPKGSVAWAVEHGKA